MRLWHINFQICRELKMDLKLNNSELNTILSCMENMLNEDNLYGIQIAAVKSVLKKINDNVQFQHHNTVENHVLEIREAFFVEGN